MAFPSDGRGPSRRPVVLVFQAYYTPGYKGGGSLRGVANLVTALSDEIDFRIVTSDRDQGDRSPFKGIQPNVWQEIGGARVLYFPPGPARWWQIARLLLATDCDLIYLNSFFNRSFSILPMWLRRLGMTQRIPVLLAPRGEFSAGALEIKATRKKYYSKLARLLRLYGNVYWHASTEHEKADIIRFLENTEETRIGPSESADQISLAPEIIASGAPDWPREAAANPRKTAGSLNVVFISRICRIKNLDTALQILAEVRGDVRFNIYGPIEDEEYWNECRQLIKGLPANVKVDYRGELLHEQVVGVFRSHHLFFFPTRGESFGHVIIEALIAGCPVLISDQTPWRRLQEEGVGWVLPLDGEGAFRRALEECVDMDEEAFCRFSRKAQAYGLQISRNKEILEMNRALFTHLLNRRGFSR